MISAKRYVFVSIGKRRIEKVVDFVPLGIGNIINLGFGDLQSDGTIDDTANSNNGDIVKVLATVVEILRLFTNLYPTAEIYFEGSTKDRTKPYNRIIKTYFHNFRKEFAIAGVLNKDNDIKITPYDLNDDHEYLAFIIKRKS
jgi:hypothetical protein